MGLVVGKGAFVGIGYGVAVAAGHGVGVGVGMGIAVGAGVGLGDVVAVGTSGLAVGVAMIMSGGVWVWNATGATMIGWPSGWAGTWAQATPAANIISALMRTVALVTFVPLRLVLRLMSGAHNYDIALGRGMPGCLPLAFWEVPFL